MRIYDCGYVGLTRDHQKKCDKCTPYLPQKVSDDLAEGLRRAIGWAESLNNRFMRGENYNHDAINFTALQEARAALQTYQNIDACKHCGKAP